MEVLGKKHPKAVENFQLYLANNKNYNMKQISSILNAEIWRVASIVWIYLLEWRMSITVHNTGYIVYYTDMAEFLTNSSYEYNFLKPDIVVLEEDMSGESIEKIFYTALFKGMVRVLDRDIFRQL